MLGDLVEFSARFSLDAPLLAASALALRVHNARVGSALYCAPCPNHEPPIGPAKALALPVTQLLAPG